MWVGLTDVHGLVFLTILMWKTFPKLHLNTRIFWGLILKVFRVFWLDTLLAPLDPLLILHPAAHLKGMTSGNTSVGSSAFWLLVGFSPCRRLEGVGKLGYWCPSLVPLGHNEWWWEITAASLGTAWSLVFSAHISANSPGYGLNGASQSCWNFNLRARDYDL